MKMHDKNTEEEKSLSGKKEDVKEQMGNFLEEKETAPEDEGAKDDEDILMKQGAPPPRGVTAFNRGGTGAGGGGGMSSGGAGGGPLRRSLFTSVALSKSGSMCASKPQKKDEGPLWKPGESVPEKLHEEPEGEYVPEGWSAKGEKEEDKKKKKDVNKSLTESRYGSQLSRNHDVGKSCGMCGRVSKSCGEQGCCEDCKKSMSATLWHESHLA